MAYAAQGSLRRDLSFDRATRDRPVDIPSYNTPPVKKKNWKDHFEEGLKWLQEKDSYAAEQSVSKAIKILSESPRAAQFNQERSTCFHTLAEIYLTRASQEMVDDDFSEMMVKSIALFEAERLYRYGSYREDKEIDREIFEAEMKFIEKVFGLQGTERCKKMGSKTMSNRQRLKEIRSRATNEYFPTLDTFPEWNSDDEEKRCHEIENIYKQICNDMKSLIAEIFDYCRQIAGPAPCNFSIIGLGSISRQELTPFSDLEFAILVDATDKPPSRRQRQYFRLLTYLIQVEIIKLGETILPSVGISSLNDFYSKSKADDWFYDDIIPMGFSFDGMMPWACKTPLGRKEWRELPRQEYIMTVDEMLSLQEISSFPSFDSVKTANVFSSICHLFGDEQLTKTYEKKLSCLLTRPDKRKGFQQQPLQIMQELLNTNKLTLLTSDYGTQQDVKKEVYRLASLFIDQLSKFFGIFGQSSWQCLREMSTKKILNEDGAKNLCVALSITTELRLRCYQRLGRQKEALPTVPQLSLTSEEKDPPCSFTTAIVRLYQSLAPLSMAISQVLEDVQGLYSMLIALPLKPDISKILETIRQHELQDPETVVAAMLQQDRFFNASPRITGMAYLRVRHLPRAFECLLSAKEDETSDVDKVDLLLVLANCYIKVGKYQEAIECCREVQTIHEMAPAFVDIDDVFGAMVSIMNAYIDQGLYNEAATVHKQFVELQDKHDSKEDSEVKNSLTFLNTSSVLFMRMKQYDKAESLLRTILQKLQNNRKHNFLRFMTLNNLAVVLFNDGRLSEAKIILNDALDLASELYGDDAVHPYFAHCLTNLADVYYGLQNMDEAERLIQQALVTYSQLHKQELIEPGIVDALIIKAKICQFYKQWDEMFISLNEAKEILGLLYENQPHANVASVYYFLGICEQKREHFLEAIDHYEEFLKIHENETTECRQTSDDCETANVLIRIGFLAQRCSYDSSYTLSCFEKALRIEEKIHGKECNHGHLANCFGSLGCYMMGTNPDSKGMEYLCKSLKMLEEIDLGSDEDYGHMLKSVGIMLEEHSSSKAEEVLRSAQTVLKESLQDDSQGALLQINSSLLKIFLQSNRIEEGLELAEEQRRLADTMFSKSSSPSVHQFLQVFSLGRFYEDVGRQNTATEMYFDLIRRLEEQVDPTDPDQDNFMNLLWRVQRQVGDIYRVNEMFDAAEDMLQRIVSSVDKTTSQHLLAKRARYRYAALYNLAAVYTQTGRYGEAHELLDNLINIYETNSESIDEETASYAFLCRGELNRVTSCYDLAMQDLEKALKMVEKFRVSDICDAALTAINEFFYAKIMNTIGLIHEQNDNLKLALEYYMCSLSTVKGIPVKVDTASFYQNAADTLKKLGQLDDALIHYKKSLEIREKLFSEDPIREDIATVLYHIAVVQYTIGRRVEASETLEKLLPLRQKLLKKYDSVKALQNYAAVLVLKGNCYIAEPNQAQHAKDAYEEAEAVLLCLTEGKPNLDYLSVLNNLGVACFMLDQWEQAIQRLEKALEMKKIIYGEKGAADGVIQTCHLLARALLKNRDYQKALPYFHEALEHFEVSQSADDETECLLQIALCHKGLKNLDLASEICGKVKELCARKSVSDKTRLEVHEIMVALNFTEKGNEDK